MGRGDAPTAVAISLKKRRQARLDSGAFSEAGLKAFVERLVGGKSMTTPLQVWPPVLSITLLPATVLSTKESVCSVPRMVFPKMVFPRMVLSTTVMPSTLAVHYTHSVVLYTGVHKSVILAVLSTTVLFPTVLS